MKKITLAVLTVAMSFFVALSMALMLNVNSVKADAGVVPTISETKYKISTNNDGLLIATGISNYNDVYEVGYVFTDSEGNDITSSISKVSADTNKYYSKITSGANLWTATDLFGEGYTGMIVWEINYDASEDYFFKAYAKVGERIDGELYESSVVEYNEARSIEVEKFQITFKNYDGEVLQQSDVKLGAMPEYTGAVPTMDADVQYTYGDFTGWDSELSAVTGNKVYTATFNNKQLNKYNVTFVSNNDAYGTVSEETLSVPYGTEIVVDENVITVGDVIITATASENDDTYDYSFVEWTGVENVVTGNVEITANFAAQQKFALSGTVSMHRNAVTTLIAKDADISLYSADELVKTVKVGENGAFDFGNVYGGNYLIKLATAQDKAISLNADLENQNIVLEYDMFKSSNAWNFANANDGNIEMTSVADLVFNNQSEDFYLEFIYKMRETDTTGSGKDARAYVKFLDENGGHYGVRIMESANNATSIAFAEWADDYSVSWTGYSFSADEQARIKGDGLKIAVIRLDGYIYVYTENISSGILTYRLKTAAKNANDSYMFRGWQVYALSGLRYVDNYDAKQITLLGSGNYYQVPNYDQMQTGSIINSGSMFKAFKTQYKNFAVEFDYKLATDAIANKYDRLILQFKNSSGSYDVRTVDSATANSVSRFRFMGTSVIGLTEDNVAAGTRYVLSDAEKSAVKPDGEGIHVKLQRVNGVISLFINGNKVMEVTVPTGFENDTFGLYGSGPVAELQNFTYVELA